MGWRRIFFYEILVFIQNLVFRPKNDTFSSKTKPQQDNEYRDLQFHKILMSITFRNLVVSELMYDNVLSRLTAIIPFQGNLMGGAMFLQREPN